MMRFLVFALVFLLLATDSYSQRYDPNKIDKKAVVLYNQAMARVEDGNNSLAAGLLVKSIETDPKYLDAYLSLAGLYRRMKNYKNSVAMFEKAFSMDSAYSFPYKSEYAISLAGLGQFENAYYHLNDLLTKRPPKNPTSLSAAEKRKRSYQFAIDYAKKNSGKSYEFAPHNAGAAINSAESEYFPSFTIDGNELVFTRNLQGRNEDFFSTRKKSNGEPEPAKPMEGDINTPMNEGAQMISQDGQWLVFTGCNRPDGYGGCDIYVSFRAKKGWREAVNMGPVINSDQWDSQPCLSPDKKEMYFSSRRFGGLGGSDLYVSRLLANGNWSKPETLGPGINTAGNEACPFMHADNQTLYFTSDALPGYGDNDLFYVKRDPSGKWSVPVNLGYPINTIDEEGTLFIAADGKTAYFASDRFDSKGGLDIYSFILREDIRPSKTLWVRGKVTDKKTTKGIPASVELIDLATKLPVTKVETDEVGNYFITLPVGKDYAFNVNKKGYLFYSDNFLLSDRSPDSIYEKNIPLQPIEANASIILKNVFFDVNKFELKPESQVELDRLIELLNDNPNVRIEISGHTDNAGKPSDNLILSNNRAKAVVTYLAGKGISVKRLTSKGFGETKPVGSNATDEGRALNRRTELKVVAL